MKKEKMKKSLLLLVIVFSLALNFQSAYGQESETNPVPIKELPIEEMKKAAGAEGGKSTAPEESTIAPKEGKTKEELGEVDLPSEEEQSEDPEVQLPGNESVNPRKIDEVKNSGDSMNNEIGTVSYQNIFLWLLSLTNLVILLIVVLRLRKISA